MPPCLTILGLYLSNTTIKNTKTFNVIVNRLYLFLTIITLVILAVHISPSYAQIADPTVAGIIVPKVTSTQVLHCLNGHCSTGGTPIIPKNYTKSVNHYPVLLISLSQTCEVLNKNGIRGCPSVQNLTKYDTSNQKISGKFVNDNGLYHRTYPQMKNNWLAYVYSKTPIVCVECYFDVTATSKSKQIIIQPNSFTYVNKTESEDKNKLYDYTGRYMQGCDIATIGNVPGLLDDTISYMLHGCVSGTTTFHTMINHTRTLQPFSYDNPFSSLHYKSVIDTIKLNHPTDCIHYTCSLTTSSKKW